MGFTSLACFGFGSHPVPGSNLAVIKDAQGGLSTAGYFTLRFTIAALAFLPLIPSAWKNAIARKAGLELGMWAAMGYLSQSVGLLSTPAARAAFISAFAVGYFPCI